MSRMKKLISMCLVCVFMLSFAVPAYADLIVPKDKVGNWAEELGEATKKLIDEAQKIVDKNEIKVKIVGIHNSQGRELKPFYIDFGNDTKPQIIGGRTMLPIRAVAEAIGYKVDWDGKNRAVTLGAYFGRADNSNFRGINQAHTLMQSYTQLHSDFQSKKGTSVKYDKSYNGFTKMALDGKLDYMKQYDEVYSSIRLWIDDNEASCSLWVDNHGLFGTYQMDVAPTIVNGKTLLPLRAVGEMMGMEVTWDNETRTATLTAKSAN